MGYNSSGGPKGLGVFTDAASTVADFNKLVALIADTGNTHVGTQAERNALSGAKLYAGLLWVNTTNKSVDMYDATLGWQSIASAAAHFGYLKTTSFQWEPTTQDHTWDANPAEGALSGFTTTDRITFTCERPGVYQIVAQVSASTGGPFGLNLDLFKQGALARRAHALTNPSVWVSACVTASLRFAVGETFKIRLTGSGTIAGLTGAATFLNVDMIHP